ncbi:hypothetical protein FACS1894202_04740 [Clostridia bacterium]|nr:hypothetical protein FACS1894202_04740 [Clostridia bacterium]
MDMPLPRKLYTYEDWLSWEDDLYTELIDGKAVMMAQPKIRHQRISGEIHRQIANYLRGKKCQVFMEAGVRLFEKKDTALIPDLIVVCDPEKLDENVCNGAPDLIVEVLSPSNFRHDKVVKFNLYLQAGVREYWIVDPDRKIVEVYILKNDEYTVRTFDENDTIRGAVVDCEINLADVFA